MRNMPSFFDAAALASAVTLSGCPDTKRRPDVVVPTMTQTQVVTQALNTLAIQLSTTLVPDTLSGNCSRIPTNTRNRQLLLCTGGDKDRTPYLVTTHWSESIGCVIEPPSNALAHPFPYVNIFVTPEAELTNIRVTIGENSCIRGVCNGEKTSDDDGIPFIAGVLRVCEKIGQITPHEDRTH